MLLALDMSTSVAAILGDLVRGAEGFLRAVRPQDAVSTATFNSGFFVLSRPGASPAAARSGLRSVQPQGATALYDALIRAVDLMKAQPSPRVIVAFTDGEDTASHASLATVRSAFQRSDTTLYLVLHGDGGDEALNRVVRETGGMTIPVRRMDTLSDHFGSIVAELKNRYVLMYSPQRPLGDERWRSIAVDVVIDGRSSGYAIRSRTGYVAVRDGDAVR